MNRDLSSKRKVYRQYSIDYLRLPTKPYELFKLWYEIAEESKLIDEPNAFTLSTSGKDNQPKSRVVLMKEFGVEGFVFYTNYNSKKAQDIAENQKVCISFFWKELERQVIIYGSATKVSKEQSDAYFSKRPLDSQLGAKLSQQSESIPLDFNVDRAFEELKEQYKNKEVTRPEHWGGFKIVPHTFEFWQGRPSRLHDRVKYTLENNQWKLERLWA